MAWWSCAKRRRRIPSGGRAQARLKAVLIGVLIGLSLIGKPVGAVTDQDLKQIAAMGTAQGRSAEEINRLAEVVKQAGARGLPAEALLDKIREGLAKRVATTRLEQVLTALRNQMETASALEQELRSRGAGGPAVGGHQRSMEVLAEALGRGVTADEVRTIARGLRVATGKVEAQALAYGAKGVALLKEGGLAPDTSTSLMTTALRHGLRPTELLALAREIKTQGHELRDNPSRLRAIQQALESGKPTDRLFRDIYQRDIHQGRQGGQIERIMPLERPIRPERPERPGR